MCCLPFASCCAQRCGSLTTVPDGRQHGGGGGGGGGGAEMDRGGDTGLRRQRRTVTHTDTRAHKRARTHARTEREDNQQTARSPRSGGSRHSSVIISKDRGTFVYFHKPLFPAKKDDKKKNPEHLSEKKNGRRRKKRKKQVQKKTLMPNKGPSLDVVPGGVQA